jgi:hypothetical protein
MINMGDVTLNSYSKENPIELKIRDIIIKVNVTEDFSTQRQNIENELIKLKINNEDTLGIFFTPPNAYNIPEDAPNGDTLEEYKDNVKTLYNSLKNKITEFVNNAENSDMLEIDDGKYFNMLINIFLHIITILKNVYVCCVVREKMSSFESKSTNIKYNISNVKKVLKDVSSFLLNIDANTLPQINKDDKNVSKNVNVIEDKNINIDMQYDIQLENNMITLTLANGDITDTTTILLNDYTVVNNDSFKYVALMNGSNVDKDTAINTFTRDILTKVAIVKNNDTFTTLFDIYNNIKDHKEQLHYIKDVLNSLLQQLKNEQFYNMLTKYTEDIATHKDRFIILTTIQNLIYKEVLKAYIFCVIYIQYVEPLYKESGNLEEQYKNLKELLFDSTRILLNMESLDTFTINDD